MRLKTAGLVLAGLLVWSGSSRAAIYTGSIGEGTGLIVGQPGKTWDVSDSVVLSWVVSSNVNGSWHYEYTVVYPSKGPSHFIVEVSENVPNEDPSSLILNEIGSGAGIVDDWDPADNNVDGEPNPGLPGIIHGVKLNCVNQGVTSHTVAFDIFRAPTWGDLYVKGGGGPNKEKNYAYNSGFLAADPVTALHDGPELGHILVPDSVTVPPQGEPEIPEPGTLALLGLGLGALARRRKRA